MDETRTILPTFEMFEPNPAYDPAESQASTGAVDAVSGSRNGMSPGMLIGIVGAGLVVGIFIAMRK